jgi:CubicO group peptidase (beta-lactamase class C family)
MNMKNLVRFSSLLVVLQLLLVSVSAQTADLQNQLKEIDQYAEKVMTDWHQPGMAIAVVKDDKVVFAKGYGKLNINEDRRVDENTLFAIASNSKAFLAASLAILVDEGKIKWEDKAAKYLPELVMYDPWVTKELTIRDMLTHRNGLATFSGDLLWYENTYSADEIIRHIRYLKPVSDFRTKFGYQNIMFIAAGQIVEKVSGKPWTEFVKERIFTPLGMSRTTTSVRNLPDNAAFPHNESGGKLRVLHHGNVDGGASAAGINSSVADLSKWLRLQLGRGTFEGKKIVSSQRIWELWQPYLSEQYPQSIEKNSPTRHFTGVGMGWFTYDYQGKKIVNHSGGLDGMLSYTVLIPEDNLGFVVLTNSEYPVFAIMMNKMQDVFTGAPERDVNASALKNYAAQKEEDAKEIAAIEAARIPNTKPSLKLGDYAGKYTDDYYGGLTIAEENGHLVYKMDASPNLVADLEHWHYDTFRLRWRPSTAYNFKMPGFVTFTLDKDAKVDAMTVDQPNNDFWFYEMSPKRVKEKAAAN